MLSFFPPKQIFIAIVLKPRTVAVLLKPRTFIFQMGSLQREAAAIQKEHSERDKA